MTTDAPEQAEPAATPAKRRGRETAVDMIRSLGLCLLVVVPLWFLAQPGDGVEQEVRVVDQAPDVQAWTSSVPGAPVPTAPDGWRPTVSQSLPEPAGLRLGWLTPSGGYAEYAASSGPAEPFLEEHVGEDPPLGDVDLAGQQWSFFRDADGSLSYVREVDGVTVVVGTKRASATEPELAALAESLR